MAEKDANYYHRRAAEARANGNERLAQIMENYASNLDAGLYNDNAQTWNPSRNPNAPTRADLQAMYNQKRAMEQPSQPYYGGGNVPAPPPPPPPPPPSYGQGVDLASMDIPMDTQQIGGGNTNGGGNPRIDPKTGGNYPDWGENQYPTIAEQYAKEQARRENYAPPQNQGLINNVNWQTDGRALAGGKGDMPDWSGGFPNPFGWLKTDGQALRDKWKSSQKPRDEFNMDEYQ